MTYRLLNPANTSIIWIISRCLCFLTRYLCDTFQEHINNLIKLPVNLAISYIPDDNIREKVVSAALEFKTHIFLKSS